MSQKGGPPLASISLKALQSGNQVPTPDMMFEVILSQRMDLNAI
jgi:hypothetical protein